MPNLERLSLDDLKQLQKKLLYITEAGEVLRGWQFDPVFDLSPGQSPMIHLTGYTMPHAWTADEAETTAAPARDDAPESHQSPLPILSDDEWLTLRTDLEAGLDPYDLPKLALGHARRAGVSVEAIHAAYQHLQNNPYLFPLPAAAIEEFRADAPAMQDALCEKAKAMDDGWEHTPNREPYQFNARNPARDAAADAAAYGYNPGIGRFPIGASVPPIFSIVTEANSVFPIGASVPPIFSIVTEADSVEPPAPPPAGGETAPDQPEQTAAMPAGAEPGATGGGGAQAAPAPAATPSATHENHFCGPLWTVDEDQKLVQIVVQTVVIDGESKAEAYRRAHAALSRPLTAINFRARNKLKDRIATALQATSKVAQDEVPETLSPIPAGPPAPAEPPGKAEGEGPENARPVAAPEQVAEQDLPTRAPVAGGDLTNLSHAQKLVLAHLRALGNKPPFDPATDLALVEALATGAKTPEVAADLGLDTQAVIARFAALTASQRDRDNRLPIGALSVLASVLRHMQARTQGTAA
jgi:hypothetical protein